MRFEIEALTKVSPEKAAEAIAAFIDSLAILNQAYLELNNVNVPRIYMSRVRYAEIESWRDIPTLLREGSGDCKSLVAWRLAEIRAYTEEEPAIHIVHQAWQDEDRLHILIKRGDGMFEDPSIKLGMRPWFDVHA